MKSNFKKSLLVGAVTLSLSSNLLIINSFNSTNSASLFNSIKEGEKLIEKKVKAEPQGDVTLNKNISNLRFNHSQFTPTGIFVTNSSIVNIYCPKTSDSVYAFIGQWGPYKSLNNGKAITPQKITLQTNDLTIIKPKISGMLYISNQSFDKSIDVKIKVSNGLSVPTFKVDETTSADFNQQLNATNSPFVELIGKNVFGTFQISLANQLWKNNLKEINKLNQIIKSWDKIYHFSNYISGLSLSSDGIAKKHHNLIHIANPDSGGGYAYATEYYISFQQSSGAGKDLFTENESNQWGLWHEVGHIYQSQDYMFDGFGEVSVNINSFWIQEELGFRNRLFNDVKTQTAIKNFINSNNPNKSIYDLNVWGRLGIYLQLHMAYGKEFFPTLNQEYRLLTPKEKPKTNDEKFQTFIKLTSKTANRNLIPFFEKWAIHANDNTKKFVQNYPLLEKDIWNNIFDNNFEENAIIDYFLKKYEPVSKVQVKKDALLNLNFGDQILQKDVEKYLVNLTSDMKLEKPAAPNWNWVNWNNKNLFNFSSINVTQPNKTGNKYLIPTRITANNSVKILGLGDTYQGIVGLNTNDKKFFISSNNTKLHSYFTGEPYVTISIIDENDNIIYKVTANGDDTTLKFRALNNINYQNNYQIKFWFAEPTRGLYYQDGEWIKVKNSGVNGSVTFKIIDSNFKKIIQ